MKLVIDESTCKKDNLSLGELLLLFSYYNDINLFEYKDILIKKGLITEYGDELNYDNIRVTNKGATKLEDYIIDSNSNKEEHDRFTALAEQLREIFPKGRKEGTTYMWRSTTAEVAKKLKTLVIKYKFTFTDEQAIEATKAYVESFGGNYKLMRLLKYFILKAVRDEDGNIEVVSEFMNLIENEGQIDSYREDWKSTLI